MSPAERPSVHTSAADLNLLTTKLARPQIPLTYVGRPRIVQLFDAGPFRRVFTCGLADVPHPLGTPPSDYAATFGRLADRFPGKTGFGYHSIRTMLVKPDVTSAP